MRPEHRGREGGRGWMDMLKEAKEPPQTPPLPPPAGASPLARSARGAPEGWCLLCRLSLHTHRRGSGWVVSTALPIEHPGRLTRVASTGNYEEEGLDKVPVMAIPIGASLTGGSGPLPCGEAGACSSAALITAGGLDPSSLLIDCTPVFPLSLDESTRGAGRGEGGGAVSLDAPQPMLCFVRV